MEVVTSTFAQGQRQLTNTLFKCLLTHCGIETPYGQVDKLMVNTGSGNSLLPGGGKPLPGM